MKKLLKNQRQISYISLAAEILALVILFLLVLYYPNENWTQQLSNILLGVIILYSFITPMVFNIIISKKKNSTELTSAELIGTNENEAYLFAQLGIIIANKDFTIRWVNDYITLNFPSVIDKSLFEIFPDLKDFVLNEDKKEQYASITSENHNYQVEYLKDGNMFIFKDVTDLTNLTALNEGNSPVIGYLNIDNYDDILQSSTDDSKFTELFYNTRFQINQYFNKKSALLRRLKEDRYMFITTKNSYLSMLDDNFSVMETVRKNQSGFTLSIGIGYGFPEYSKISELASSANDIAMSRGGDQAVIHPAKENFIYVGGKSELKTSRNKVKMRTFGDSLIATIANFNKILIMGHINADFDAIGAALGVYVLADYTNDNHSKSIRVAFEPSYVEAKCRKSVELEFTKDEMDTYFVDSKEAEQFFDDSTLLVLVDHNSAYMSMYPQITQRAKNVIIIDHHRPDQKAVSDTLFKDIDTSSSSTSELITEFIYYTKKEIKIPSRIATFLLSGIALDTRSFKYNASSSTYESASILKEFGADSSKVEEFLKEGWEEFKQKISILNTADSPYPGVIIADNKDDEIVSDTMLAIVATEAIQISEVSTVFCIGRISEHQIKISGRSDGTVNCQMLLEKLGGGGHFSMAACVLNETTVDDAKKRLLAILNDYLDDATVKMVRSNNEDDDDKENNE